MTTLQIKICGMCSSENVEAIKPLAPDFLGYIFYPKSKRYVGETPDIYLFVLPSNIKKVAVFVNETTENMLRICQRFNFDYVQLHGDETPQQCAELKQEGRKVIKAFAIDESFDFTQTQAYAAVCEHFLFDTKTVGYGGSGEKFNWQVLHNYKVNKSFFLSGGIQLRDAAQIKELTHQQLVGVDVNSGFEIEAGIKDNRQIAIFKQLLQA